LTFDVRHDLLGVEAAVTQSFSISSGPSGVRSRSVLGVMASTVVLKKALMAPSRMRFSRSGLIQYLTLGETDGPRTTSVTAAPWRKHSRAALADEFFAPTTATFWWV
jgi:hypothetical protein